MARLLDGAVCLECPDGDWDGYPAVPCRGHQNRDGTSHATFFFAPLEVSFVWDGRSDHIEVSRGGYGEPVFAHILVEPTGGKVDLSVFQLACENWIRDTTGTD